MLQKEKSKKKYILFKTTPKRINYLEINLSKDAKDIVSENYKTLMKEIEDNTKKWKAITRIALFTDWKN